uniref:Uncharacterized protein n=1 Tax=Glossina palpalis gambiensis TaxID=67801 RepID=A0A1B0BTU4_9MUSC
MVPLSIRKRKYVPTGVMSIVINLFYITVVIILICIAWVPGMRVNELRLPKKMNLRSICNEPKVAI